MVFLADIGIRPRKRGKSTELSELTATVRSLIYYPCIPLLVFTDSVADEYPPRQYFVLTDAGKPVFTTLRDEDSVEVASSIGIMQALISVFLDDRDKLRSINAGSCRITFLLRQPLYYVCVSSWGEPESVVSILHFACLAEVPLGAEIC